MSRSRIVVFATVVVRIIVATVWVRVCKFEVAKWVRIFQDWNMLNTNLRTVILRTYSDRNFLDLSWFLLGYCNDSLGYWFRMAWCKIELLKLDQSAKNILWIICVGRNNWHPLKIQRSQSQFLRIPAKKQRILSSDPIEIFPTNSRVACYIRVLIWNSLTSWAHFSKIAEVKWWNLW